MQRGLGAFVQGAFQGYQFGEGVKDKKAQRERQKKDDAWLDKSRKRQETVWGQQDTLWERKEDAHRRAERERGVFQEVYEDAKESYGENQNAEAPPLVEGDPQTVEGGAGQDATTGIQGDDRMEEQRGPRAQDGYQRPPEPSRGLAGPDAASLGRMPEKRPDSNDSDPRSARPATMQSPEPPSGKMPQRQPGLKRGRGVIGRRVEDARIAVEEIRTGVNSRTGQRLSQPEIDERISLVEGVEAQARTDGYDVRDTGPPKGPPGPEFARWSPGMTSAPNSGMRPSMGRGPGGQDAPPAARQAPGSPAGPSSDMSPSTAGMRPPVDQAGRTAPTAPTAPDGRDAAPTSPEAEQAEAEAVINKAVTAPPDQGGAPSLALAADTAPEPKPNAKGVVGRDRPVKSTKKQQQKAADSFLDHYAKTAVPKVVEYYLSTGNIEKAEAFEAWAGSREAKGQLESWSKAVHSATIGDDDAFLDHMADTYNAYDDGYEVIRSESGFTRDDDGNITGAELVFKNKKTGETFQKDYENKADIVREGLYALAPEQVFERLWGEVEQAGKVAADQQKFERQIILEQVKRGMKAPEQNADDIAMAKKALSEQYFAGGLGEDGTKAWNELSREEQDQVALEYVRANRDAGRRLANEGSGGMRDPQALADELLGN